MSVLSDRDLKKRLPSRLTGADRADFRYVDPIVSPYAEDRVQPSSYDVALGNSFRVPEYYDVLRVDLADPPTGMMHEIHVEDDGYLMIHPGDFVLASTKEWVELPNDLVCRLEGKSSVGRLGLLIHATAGFIDPGFKGNITLEMTNFLRVPIQVRPGQMIAQLAFQTLTTEVDEPYRGRYQGDKGATESRYGQRLSGRTAGQEAEMLFGREQSIGARKDVSVDRSARE